MKRSDKIQRMWGLFGRDCEHTCRECNHLKKYEQGRVFNKCECYGISSCESTDFPVSFFACGLFNKPYDGEPVYLQKFPRKKEIFEQEETLF